jgi:hypothetical protein
LVLALIVKIGLANEPQERFGLSRTTKMKKDKITDKTLETGATTKTKRFKNQRKQNKT